MDDPQIFVTGDGSHSLLNVKLNETYHSRHGALRESLHVFIESGLRYFCAASSIGDIRVLEVGFGTGLNALLTTMFAQETNCSIHYTTLEAYPIRETIWTTLNYGSNPLEKDVLNALHASEWESDCQISPHFTLYKTCRKLQEVSLSPASFDVVFFDAFAPNKQPEMWELPILRKVTDAMSREAVFVTYCAKGQLKRDLAAVGLNVTTLPGPPGKKEMVRATKGL